jgi:hypothetical protein
MHKQGKLWGLWLAPAIGGLVVLSAVYAEVGKDSSSARVALLLDIEELHSQVAESRLLAERGARGELTGPFVREHARQLARHMRAALADARSIGTEAGVPAATEEVTRLGAASLNSLQDLADNAESATALQEVAAKMAMTGEALSRLDRTLRRRAP